MFEEQKIVQPVALIPEYSPIMPAEFRMSMASSAANECKAPTPGSAFHKYLKEESKNEDGITFGGAMDNAMDLYYR